MAKIIFSHETTPSPPPAGTVVLYSKSDGRVYSMDELGAETPLTRDNLGTLAFQNASAASIGGTSSVNLSGGSITLAANQILWTWVSKVGSSIAQLETKNHSDVTDDQPEKHRLINDAATSTTSLWSSNKIATELSSVGVKLTSYVVGKEATDPYSSIQVAIDAAVTAGASFANPAVVIVKPGVYTENVTLAVGVNVISLIYEKSFMTKVVGTLTFNSGAGGSVLDKVSTWVGIDVVGDGSNPTLSFSGSNPQRLNITNCELSSAGPAYVLSSTNTGTDSVIVVKDVDLNHLGSGGDAAQAVYATAGKLNFFKVKVSSSFLDAIDLINDTQVEWFYVYTVGRVVLGNTAGGIISNLITNAGATEAVVMGSSGILLLANSVSLGFDTLVGGANPSNVVQRPGAITVPFDNSDINYTATNVQAALVEMEKKADAIIWFEGSNPPGFVNIDDYNFSDGSAFPHGVDNDVIFRIDPARKYQQSGLRLVMHYCMSSLDTGDVRLKFDYRIKQDADPVGGGTDYQNFYTLTPLYGAQVVELFTTIVIPLGVINSDTDVIHCRLTRLGTDVLDTHSGDFCVFAIGVVGL